MTATSCCLAMLMLFASNSATSAQGHLEFNERSVEWGLDFQHHHGGSGRRYMVETMVGGVIVLDYDGDGDDDVLWVDGGTLPGYSGERPKTVLHRNDLGQFVDVSASAGLTFSGYGCGGAAADIDGDGDIDILLTAFGANALFVNQGDGTFLNETEERGLSETIWNVSAAFADADLDGDLDLYIGSYVDFSLENHKQCGKPEEGILGYCHPDSYQGERDRFYLNQGNGTFVESGETAGLGAARAATLGVIFADLDGDMLPDLYLANDLDPNQMFLNLGAGKFEDVSLISGAGYSLGGRPEAGMGVELADLDGDGKSDLIVTNFALEPNAYYRNMGSGLFIDARYPARLAEPSLNFLGFGLSAADFDHDGDQDLFVANGHILDNAEQLSTIKSYAQRNQLMRNDGGRFEDVQDIGIDAVRVSRGAAQSDLDLDGDVDILVINSNQRAEVYENIGAPPEKFIQIDLRGANNSSSVGARVELRTLGVAGTQQAKPQSATTHKDGTEQARNQAPKIQQRIVKVGGSYLSQSSLVTHFGVSGSADSVTVFWPNVDGAVLRIAKPPLGKRLQVWPVSPQAANVQD